MIFEAPFLNDPKDEDLVKILEFFSQNRFDWD